MTTYLVPLFAVVEAPSAEAAEAIAAEGVRLASRVANELSDDRIEVYLDEELPAVAVQPGEHHSIVPELHRMLEAAEIPQGQRERG